ncbi:HAD-like domain-containing protein [Radiomyces spectabilis]|uniref:HAD-like domain-containing protein n=1 Tax=Radiomyces spectabilis TaxID=64574 RepID=UPI00221FF7AB|nr:HAD-like domain-containing protein [Radiomyces spectabilis]KAI8381528.1 HAD-like domain-containing protein [Radiomyces spectabilis]
MPAVAFDFLETLTGYFVPKGTLYTFDKVIDRLHKTFKNHLTTRAEAEAFFYSWHWAALRDYFGTSHAGRYCPLIKMLRNSLRRALLVRGYRMPKEFEENYIMASFKELEPVSTAVESLELLKENGWDIWILTNGGYQNTLDLLQKSQLTSYIGDNVLSCDDLNISKPHPKVYSELMRMAVHRTQRIENFYMVATHAWDLAGAKNVSMRTVYLTTEEKVYVKQHDDDGGPDIQGDTMIECIEKMITLEKTRKHFL